MGRADIVYEDGVFTITRLPEATGFAFGGEIDAATHQALTAALVTLDGDHDVRLDLTGLVFCDAVGLGTMVSVVERLDPGRRLVLTGVSAPLCKLLTIVGWMDLPSLEVHPRPGERPAADGRGVSRPADPRS